MSDTDFATWISEFPWFTLIVAFGIAVVSVPMLIPMARRTGWVDRPSARKPHEGEVPIVGGWAVLLAVLPLQVAASDAMAPAGFWAGALLLFIVALVDDRSPIAARYRFMVQCTAAIAGISMGGQALLHLGDLLGMGPLSSWWIVMPVSVVGTMAVINAVNFSDGADGLCGGLAFISIFWFLVAVATAAGLATNSGVVPASFAKSLIPLAAALMGGLAGFLFFNMRSPWRARAAVFLGDSGSMFIGFTLAWFAIHVTTAFGPASVQPVVCLWIMALPLFDSASCIVRRILAGVPPMTADTKHLHHLLRRNGLSVGESVAVTLSGSFLCGLAGVSGWWLGIPEHLMFAVFAGALGTFVYSTNWAWHRLDVQAAEVSPLRPDGDHGSVAVQGR